MLRRSAVLACLLIVLSPGIALAQEAGDQVVLSGDVSVPKGVVSGDVVVLHGSARIDGVVRGAVVVLDGPVQVSGQVGGDIVATDGDVSLAGTAQVAGDVLSGGEVEIAQGAQVAGRIREDVACSLSGALSVLGTLRAPVAMAVSVLVMLLALILLAPAGAESVAKAARTAPVRSALWGIAMAALVPIAALGGTMSILAMPFGLSVLLALGLFWMVGQAWAAWIVGRVLVSEPRPRWAAVAVGWLVGAAVGLVPGLNVVWWVLGSVFGLGATVVAAWRARGPGPAPEALEGKHARGRVSGASTALPETPLAED